MERSSALGALRTALGMLVAGPLLAVLAMSRLMPPADLSAAGLGWGPVALASVLVATAVVASGIAMLVALRRGGVADLLVASASSAVAGGAIAWVSGAPFVLPVALAGAALAGASIAGRRRMTIDAWSARAGAAAGLLLVVELGVVAELLPETRSLLAPVLPPVAVVGAALAVVAVVLGAGCAIGPVASGTLVGIAAMAVTRAPDGLEPVIGLGALLGAQLVAIAGRTLVPATVGPTLDHRLPALAEHLPDAILRFDGRLRLSEWNGIAAGLLGLDAASMGAHLEDLLGVAVRELPLPGGPPSTVGGVGGLRVGLVRSGDGVIAIVHDRTATPEAERLGRELRGTIEELLQARRTIDLQRQELERASAIDPLTGVRSRTAIVERLRVEVAQARRYQHAVGVVLLDVDDFATINRTHGTTAGDGVLREVALRIRLRVREADELGRIGSDAFLAVLPHTEEAGASTFADALLHRIGLRPIVVGAAQLTPTASIGVAVMRPGDDLDVDTLLARAEEALASAKRGGGNRVALDRLHGLARLEDRHNSRTVDEEDVPGAV